MRNILKTSPIWAIFTITDSSEHKALCNICGMTFSYKATISNLKKHLLRKHPTVDLEAVRQDSLKYLTPNKTQNLKEEDDLSDEKMLDVSIELHENDATPMLETNKEKANTTRKTSDETKRTIEKQHLNNITDDELLTKYLTSRLKKIEDSTQKIYAETLITQIISKAILNQLTENSCISELHSPSASFNVH